MSPFYSKTGDDGTTGLLGAQRVDKDDLRIEVIGSLDELSAALGMARSLCSQSVNDDLKKIQVTIYELMSELAATKENVSQFAKIDEASLEELESMIDRYADQTKMPTAFILPGDSTASAALSVARTTTRRAERRLVQLSKKENSVRKILLKYLNRLSSLLYVLEIHVIQNQAGILPSLVKKKAK